MGNVTNICFLEKKWYNVCMQSSLQDTVFNLFKIMEWFIQLHRKMIEWEWYDDINTKVLFIHLLIKANWSNKSWRWIEIKRWEVLTGRIILSKETWLTQQQIRTSLNKLKSTNEITSKTTNKYSIIKLINYNNYQQVTNKPLNEQPTSNQQ